MEYGAESVIDVEYQGRFAILTINNPKKANALSRTQYYELSQKLREVAARDDVFVTVLLGKGRFFSAGADVGMPRASPKDGQNLDIYREYLQSFAAHNLNLCHAFATHPKILVAGLNGPAVGMSAAVVAHADFVYCAEGAYVLTPFSSLGLVAEGGASAALARRLGPARAMEAMVMSKRIPAAELERCGFVNAVLKPEGSNTAAGQGEGDWFRERLLREVKESLGEHLNGESMLGIKALIRKPDMETMHRQNLQEVFAGLERFVSGVPQEQFRKIARGEKRHKL